MGVKRILRKHERKLRAASIVPWQERAAAVILIGRHGVVLCEHRRSPPHWDDELAKRFLGLAAMVEKDFSHRSRVDKLEFLEFGDYAIAVVHGESVLLVIELTSGGLLPDQRALIENSVAELERRYGADLAGAKNKQFLPALDESLTKLLGLAW